MVDDVDGDPKPAGNIGDFGGSDGSTERNQKRQFQKQERDRFLTQSRAPEGYRYCTTCDAGPWEVGNSDTGRGIVDYHIGLGCDVVECNERGVVKE